MISIKPRSAVALASFLFRILDASIFFSSTALFKVAKWEARTSCFTEL